MSHSVALLYYTNFIFHGLVRASLGGSSMPNR
jgi:hypothetical protein